MISKLIKWCDPMHNAVVKPKNTLKWSDVVQNYYCWVNHSGPWSDHAEVATLKWDVSQLKNPIDIYAFLEYFFFFVFLEAKGQVDEDAKTRAQQKEIEEITSTEEQWFKTDLCFLQTKKPRSDQFHSTDLTLGQ